VSIEIDIEDVKSYLRGKERHPIMTVKDTNDPDYKSIRQFVRDIRPETEDYLSAVTSQMNRLMSSLRHMESSDYNRIVTTFKKYEVKGSSGGITGRGTYGYDRSRVDGMLIKRKRTN
jgi:hypothetical protein|tara:strand:+ start:239 stop:589 length:351 start_codon:yes stop_codon:yes gene_type:complete